MSSAIGVPTYGDKKSAAMHVSQRSARETVPVSGYSIESKRTEWSEVSDAHPRPAHVRIVAVHDDASTPVIGVA